MQRRTVERIEDWPSRSFTGGSLSDLLSTDFCGAVYAGAWLLVYDGRSVGVFDGTMEDIQSTDGTIYKSPEPVLPLLFAMLECDPVRRGQYHTDEMPVENALAALEQREFTGYLDLTTDNAAVYVVYTSQTSPARIAFTTADRQSGILTGGNADRVLNDAVGSYTITAVDLTTDEELPVGEGSSSQGSLSAGSDVGLPVTEDSTQSQAGQRERLITDGSSESVEQLRSRIEDLEGERDELRAERDGLYEERERLEARISELKSRLNAVDSSVVDEESVEMSADQALSGTSLFVRYRDQSGPTLMKVYEGEAHPEDTNDNLILERHTTFDADNVVVNGVPYDQYLTDTLEYAIVQWIVQNLPFEIYDAQYENKLADLYDYIPDIDRVGLRPETEMGDGTTVAFDLVCFDQHGEPLIVANIDDSRDPTTAHKAEELLDNASLAADQWPITGAFLITTSYFDASAFDIAEEATSGGGGLFSSDDRASYVRLSRKHGFHLCLIEGRQRQFHVAVPSL